MLRRWCAAPLLLVCAACGGDAGNASPDASMTNSVSGLIGPSGGTLQLLDGGKVEIPAGALAADTRIKITKLELDQVAPVPFNLEAAGKPYAFEPHGTNFAQPVKITVPYEGDDATQLRPIKLDDERDTTWTTVVDSEKEEPTKLLSFNTTSFSVILAARPRRNSGVVTLPDGATIPQDAGHDAMTPLEAGLDSSADGTIADASIDAAPVDAANSTEAGTDARVDAGSTGTDAGRSSPAEAILTASNADSSDQFGVRVAIDGDTIVVGAREERSNATGISGDQANNTLSGAGAAYVFVRSGASWVQQAYLKASNTGTNDWFGSSVAISGDTIVIGAPRESSDATGINGDGLNNNAIRSGAAYVFVRNGTTWSQQAYLKASNTGADDNFGVSVAIDGDIVIVGADFEDSGGTGIDGNQADESVTNNGAAYVFERTGTTWTQAAYLKVGYSTPTDDDHFGCSVAASGTTVAVGAYFRERGAAGINGDEQVVRTPQGAVYVFTRTAGIWSREAFIRPNTAGNLGHSVALRGDLLVAGAIRDTSNATGVNGNPNDTSLTGAGAALVYTRVGTTWSETAYLKASNTGAGDNFGDAVAIGQDVIIVGARLEDSSTSGVGGTTYDDGTFDSGAAYVFTHDGQQWTGPTYYKADNPGENDQYGIGVAAFGDRVVVGSFLDDTARTNAGAAYVYRIMTP